MILQSSRHDRTIADINPQPDSWLMSVFAGKTGGSSTPKREKPATRRRGGLLSQGAELARQTAQRIV